MIKFFTFSTDFKRSMIEVKPNISYREIEPYISPEAKKKMPSNVKFKIAKGKKLYDSIRHFESIGEFYSQKFINILSEFYDLSKNCYTLNIEEMSEKYFNFYNLESAEFINRDYSISAIASEPWMFLLPSSLQNIFCLKDSYIVVISEEAKIALEKAKITNIRFKEVYGCTLSEKEEWEIDHRGMPLPLSEREVYDAWKEKYKEKYIKWDNPEIYFF
jgi:hypothetical protein